MSTSEAAGARLTDEALLAALDLGTPGLEAVKRAGDAGDTKGGIKALAAYLRARTSVPWTVAPTVADHSAVSWNKEAAEDAVAGKIRVVTILHTFPGGDIDWLFNKTVADPGLPDNNEWQWQLNRMHWWSHLGRAYQATGDERYAQAWVRQLRKWIEQCPPPAKQQNGAGSPWRTIESGIRMSGAWPDAYHRFLRSSSFTDDDVAAYLKTVLAHARYLKESSTRGNWLTMEMSGLYTVGALFPEFKEAKAWRTFAADKLYQEMATQFLPDGAQVELTPGYHNVALDNVLRLFRVAQRVGRTGELPGDYVARMERAFGYNLHLMTPDRNLPRFNDSWPTDVPARMAEAAALFPGRADFAWAATNGEKGAPPKQASTALPYAGYFVMRSGWEPTANYAVFDAGPLGYGHVHQDKLNLVVWAWGRELLFDGGGGSYERSKWRAYATDTFSHNTILVDGKPQRRQTKDREANVSRTPIDAGWQSAATHDFARGVYEEGYGTEDSRPVAHTRRVLFLKPDAQGGAPVFVVADTLAPKDGAAHTYQARWHLLTTQTRRDPATGIVATTDGGQANLAVVPLLAEGVEVRAASAQTEPELLGWHVRKDMDPQYVPATTVLHTRRGAGVQRFLTLLVPIKPGAASPIRQVRATGAGSAEVLLSDGGRLLVTDGPQGSLSVTELRADGKPGRKVTAG